jgi:pimeloyl-ACP methyl ester carboxylesterase
MDITFENQGLSLSGTITLPAQSGHPHSGLVLVGGSGPTDRHHGGYFDTLGDHLTDAGVAVLSYDKRGVGASTGTWATATVDELAGDAAAACAALQAHERVAPDAVGVLGHSEGGWVALRVCARQRVGTRLILNSCPSVSFIDAEEFALVAEGASPREAAAAAVLLRELTRAAESGAELSAGQRMFAAARDEPWYATVLASGFVLDEEHWSMLRAWGSYDPSSDLAGLLSPALVVLGADDPLVPVQASVAAYELTAREAGRAQELVLFAGADHRLNSSDTGRLADGYLSTLSRWALAGQGEPR